jgi:hypothetical protein
MMKNLKLDTIIDFVALSGPIAQLIKLADCYASLCVFTGILPIWGGGRNAGLAVKGIRTNSLFVCGDGVV